MAETRSRIITANGAGSISFSFPQAAVIESIVFTCWNDAAGEFTVGFANQTTLGVADSNSGVVAAARSDDSGHVNQQSIDGLSVSIGPNVPIYYGCSDGQSGWVTLVYRYQ